MPAGRGYVTVKASRASDLLGFNFGRARRLPGEDVISLNRGKSCS
jgi:hypothetical protein